jgi:hypothetical protein
MRSVHQPSIHRRSDGQWEVNCPGCLDAQRLGLDIPVGICLPIRTREVAQRLVDNHLRSVGEGDVRSA